MVNYFSYHSSTASRMLRPVEELRDENIKGIELEIYSNDDYPTMLSNLVDTNDVICYDNRMNASDRGNIVLESDCSVNAELICQADLNDKIMEMIRRLNKELNPDTITNRHGVSSHIHLNRRYLSTLGLHQRDIIKAGEFFNEILFKISDRTHDDFNQWTRSILKCPLEDNLVKKAKHIDNNNFRSSGRYNIVNIEPSNTIEFRIFSNYHNFNYDKTQLFLEFCDHIIDVAEMMQGKKYTENVDTIVDMTNEWFEATPYRKDIYIRNDLNNILLTEEQMLLEEKRILQVKVTNMFDNFLAATFDNEIEREKEFWRILRRINSRYGHSFNQTITLGNIDYEHVINKMNKELK